MRTLHVQSLEAWREWLAEHHASVTEVWLVFHKRHTGVASITYKDALDEALCFRWVDSLLKRLDERRYARKFTPRRANSKWSDVNRKRYADLKAAGRLQPAGIDRPPTNRGYDFNPSRLALPAKLPAYIQTALKKHPAAWRHFKSLPPSQQRRYFAWIDSAKREETKRRRLEEAIGLLSSGKAVGVEVATTKRAQPVSPGQRRERFSAPHQRNCSWHPRRYRRHGAAAGALLRHIRAVLVELAIPLRPGDREGSARLTSASRGSSSVAAGLALLTVGHVSQRAITSSM